MCGIYGFIKTNQSIDRSTEDLDHMERLLNHRGPDGSGRYLDEDIAFGHTRLSIIDIQMGAQPMLDWLNRYVVTFNGEIYNFQELRSIFKKRGFCFQTNSDTEVILAAYHYHGENCFELFQGMFALALWDRDQKKLVLARDRVGKKPLYYYHHCDRLVFASEMKAILALPGIPRELNFEAFHFYLTYGYIPAPLSIFKKIHKVKEAHVLVLQNRNLQQYPYWTLPGFEQTREHNEAYYIDELEQLLTETVRCRLVSDVPLGAFLSGGIDSSAIVAMMAKISNSPVKTFTIDFEDTTFSEVKDASRVARHCRTLHHELKVTTDAVTMLPELIWHFDEPFADSSAIPSYYVAKMAREHVTVILSGDGGDELFAGYNSYQKRHQYKNWLRLPGSLRKTIFGQMVRVLPVQAPGRNFFKFLAAATPNAGMDFLGFYPYIKEDVIGAAILQKLQLHDPQQLRQQVLAELKPPDLLSRLQYLDLKLYLPGDILVKIDRMSMANSLETRAPLLDYRLVEFASRLPQKMKMYGHTGKYILKKVLQKYIPAEILSKPKHGFAVPISRWFRTTLTGFTREILLDERCRKRGFFNVPVLEKVIRFHTLGQRDYSEWIYLLLVLELWCQTFMDTDTRRI